MQQHKQLVIDGLKQWIKESDKYVVRNDQYHEAKALLMVAQQDYLSDKGWDELEFYVAMLEFSKNKLPSSKDGVNIALAG